MLLSLWTSWVPDHLFFCSPFPIFTISFCKESQKPLVVQAPLCFSLHPSMKQHYGLCSRKDAGCMGKTHLRTSVAFLPPWLITPPLLGCRERNHGNYLQMRTVVGKAAFLFPVPGTVWVNGLGPCPEVLISVGQARRTSPRFYFWCTVEYLTTKHCENLNTGVITYLLSTSGKLHLLYFGVKGGHIITS